MWDTEIPMGTRAIMFCFTTTQATPRVTLDLLRYPTHTYSQLESMAINAVLRAGKGDITGFTPHFIK